MNEKAHVCDTCTSKACIRSNKPTVCLGHEVVSMKPTTIRLPEATQRQIEDIKEFTGIKTTTKVLCGKMADKQICPHCKEEIPMQIVQQGGLHLHCYEADIDVWFISLPAAPDCGYVENDLCQVVEMLKTAEDPYVIERQQMKAGKYYNLPEFQGF